MLTLVERELIDLRRSFGSQAESVAKDLGLEAVAEALRQVGKDDDKVEALLGKARLHFSYAQAETAERARES